MSDETLLIDDGALALKLGTATVQVRPLCIEPSLQWVRRVRVTLYEVSQKETALASAAQADDASTVDALIREGVGVQFAGTLRDLLNEHSPDVLTQDVLGKATARQIVSAFGEVFREECPLSMLRSALGPLARA